ncbi:RNA chaperone Hfq [Paraburkholderia sp.]|uniref:RNA chaperone Hfq n=1 Tax=Paraburkholderia sp. TaxID=1926495 RepID=UPI0039E215C0
MNTYDQERAEQLREGARMARVDDDTEQTSRPRLSLSPGRRLDCMDSVNPANRRPARTKPTNSPKGHEAFLKALHESGARIRVHLRDEDATLVGKIRAHDKYTISLDAETHVTGETETNVVYKHAIQRFIPLPRPRVQAEEGAVQ